MLSRVDYKSFIYSIIILISCLWFYQCVSLHFNAYNNFAIYATDDISDYNQAAWNTAQGRPFLYNDRYTEERILAHQDTTTTALHSNFIFLFISLFYLILPHFASFMLLQSLFLAISIIALYLLCSRIFSEKRIMPLLIVLIYSQYFPLTSIAHFFHPEPFSIFFIFLALYFYWRDRLGPTLIFCALAIFCREEISLVFAVLGMVSYFIPGKRKYFLPLVLMGVLSFLFIRTCLTKYVTAPLLIEGHYGYLGRTFAEKIKNLIFNPGLMINNTLKLDRIAIFRGLFETLLYLPFLAPVLLLPGGVILAEVMLSNSWSMGTLRWQPWYLCPLIPFIFLALAAALEKVYLLKDKILKTPILSKKPAFYRVVKAIPLVLISFLFLCLYIRNFSLTQSHINDFRDYFSITRYWSRDTFTLLSGIKKDAKVVCSLKLMPMLSSRRYILPQDKLTQKLLNQGFYDTIILSESDYIPDISGYLGLIKNNPLYQKVYYTPYLSVFAKKDYPSSLSDWKSDLIAEIKNSKLTGNYIIFNFTDFATIVENSGLVTPEYLVEDFYRNSQIQYAQLEPVKTDVSRADTIYFIPDKPLEKNCRYLLAFAAKTQNNTDVIYVKKPSDNKKSYDEIKIDNKLRLVIIPFVVYNNKIPVFTIQMNEHCSILKPVLLRYPSDRSEKIDHKNIFEVKTGSHTFNYNPWLERRDLPMEEGKRSFLKRYPLDNPLLYLMRLLRLPIPQDLYRYSWQARQGKFAEILAVKY